MSGQIVRKGHSSEAFICALAMFGWAADWARDGNELMAWIGLFGVVWFGGAALWRLLK